MFFFHLPLSPPNFCTRSSTFATSTTHTIPLYPPIDPNKHTRPRAVVPNEDVAFLTKTSSPLLFLLLRKATAQEEQGTSPFVMLVLVTGRNHGGMDASISAGAIDRNPHHQQQQRVLLEQGRGCLARMRRRTTTDQRHHRHATTKEGGRTSARGHPAPYPLDPPLLGWGRY
jgi:hypothetical protein